MPIQIQSLADFKKDLQEAKAQAKPVVGIDLGTTNSLIAIVENGKPRILRSPGDSGMVPSVVHFESNQVRVGKAAREQKSVSPENTVYSVKRLIGKGPQDLEELSKSFPFQLVGEESTVGIKVGNEVHSPIKISAIILKELKKRAEESLGVEVSQAVITVPAYFNDSQRQATRTAGKLAGLEVLRIINEPTAASLAYGIDKKKQGLIAVFDLGGGTFDISILKLKDGIFEVLSTNGNTHLGGDDLDEALALAMAQEIQADSHIDARSLPSLWANLLTASEQVKKTIGAEQEAVVRLDLPGGETYEKRWSLQEFESVLRPIILRTKEPSLAALRDAGVNAEDLSDVLLVGGPTRMGLVRSVVEEIFGQKPHTEIHPDEAVALGAAIQADILAGKTTDLLLLDVIPLSIGIETYGGAMSTLISRNSQVPAVAKEMFTNFVDNQTGVDIHVLQGEREKAEHNRSLGRFHLKGLEPVPAGMHRIEVSFLVDADGILQVSALDQRSKKQQTIEVRPSFGLTDEEVENMLREGLEHKKEDAKFSELLETKNKAAPVIHAVEKTLPDAKRLLSIKEVKAIESAVDDLKEELRGEETLRIRSKTERLNQLTVRLAELIIREKLDEKA